jgi:hypothetical protein
MPLRIGPLVSALLEGVLIITVIALIPHSGLMPHLASACPNCWVGRDDGEFDWYTSAPRYVWVDESITTPLTWNNYNCNPGVCNIISLQYNPDYWTALNTQGYWFQTVTATDPNNCSTFWIQVYDMGTGGQVWAQSYPNGGACNVVGGITSSHSYWLIQEDTRGSGSTIINEVDYQLQHCTDPLCNGYTWMSDSIFPPQNYFWLRSNICWCGANYGSVPFTGAGGSSNMASDQTLRAIDPPQLLSTGEDSNMQYGCITGSPSTNMYQSFGLNGHC